MEQAEKQNSNIDNDDENREERIQIITNHSKKDRKKINAFYKRIV